MGCWILLLMLLFSLAGPGYAGNRGKTEERRSGQIKAICLNPVGLVKRRGERTFLEIAPELAPALKGIQDFSHIWVFYWFHEQDRPAERQTLQVHPRRDPANPLTGVFACRTPARPNLIGLTACRLLKVDGTVLEVAGLDANDGSPILDLKPYIPAGDSLPAAVTPAWVKHPRPPAKETPPHLGRPGARRRR